MMKKLMFVICAAVIFAFAAYGLASPPVKPPAEGYLIATTTDIECVGSVTETESYSAVIYEGIPTGFLIIDEEAGIGATAGSEIRYEEAFTANDGYTVFKKDFAADSHNAPNLLVHKDIGYVANPESTVNNAVYDERVGTSIVSQGGAISAAFTGLLSLCPFAERVTTSYGATNEGIAAGSTFDVTYLHNFSADTSVTTTSVPALSYSVSAKEEEEGIYAGIGDIAAMFVVELWESNRAMTSADDVPPVVLRTSYEEYASASGAWNFEKSMSYQSVFPSVSMPTPFQRLFP